MKAWLLIVAAVAGCKSGSKAAPSGDADCELVRKTPQSAMVELSKKYPNNPVKVAQTIENCVAPTGDECERVAAIVKAIPTMAPGVAMPDGSAGFAATCRQSPPEWRHCYLPSYVLAHDVECTKLR